MSWLIWRVSLSKKNKVSIRWHKNKVGCAKRRLRRYAGKIGVQMKETVNTPDAPSAIGPYSQAVFADGFLFVSGQLPLVPTTGEIVQGGIEAQARQSLSNLKAIIEAKGMRLEDVVKTTVFLADMNDFAAMNGVYAEFFTAEFPARAAVQVARLPKDALVEIEAVAVGSRTR